MPIDHKSMWEVFRGQAAWGRKVPGPLNEGLVGYWKFQAATGTTLFDYSAHQNHGTISGATWDGGKVGPALSFDGVDDYVDISNDSSIRGFTRLTLLMWLKHPPTAGSNQYVYEEGYWTAPNYGIAGILLDSSSAIDFYLKNTNGDLAHLFYPYIVDQWYQAGCVWDGTTFYAVKNGSFVDSITFSGIIDPTTPLTLGSRNDHIILYDGYISELRMYNRALTEQEVKALYDAVK